MDVWIFTRGKKTGAVERIRVLKFFSSSSSSWALEEEEEEEKSRQLSSRPSFILLTLVFLSPSL